MATRDLLHVKTGRHPKINKDVQDIIVEGVTSNMPYKFCAWEAGITERTIYNWLKWGEEDSNNNLITDWSEFFHAIKKAEAKKVKEHMRSISEKPEKWQAIAWLLERRWKKDFSQMKDESVETEDMRELLVKALDKL